MTKNAKSETKKPVNVERPKRKPKILVFDIETSPNLVYTWGLFNQNVSLEQVVKEKSVLSIAWKWLGEPETFYQSIPIDQEDKWDDSELMKKVHELFSEADALIGHYISGFDVPVLCGRMYHHGLPPLIVPRIIDTKTMAQGIGKHLSNKLAWLTKDLGERKSSHGKFPGFTLWSEFIKGNPEAGKEMEDYNRQDVISNEALFNRLLPYSKVNMPGVQGDKVSCPRCGSNNLKKRGVSETLSGWYQRYRCSDCGGWSQSRFTHRPRDVSRNTLKAI